jgi:hypothetical protein
MLRRGLLILLALSAVGAMAAAGAAVETLTATADTSVSSGSSNATNGSACDSGLIDMRLDFDTGDFSQFTGVQQAPPGSTFDVVTSPVREGSHAGKSTLQPYDGRHTFAVKYSNEQDGEDRYYGFSMLFPSGFAQPTSGGLALEWVPIEQDRYPGPARIGLVYGSTEFMNVTINTGDTTNNSNGTYQEETRILSSLSKGQWNDFVMRIRWDSCPSYPSNCNGVLTIWHKLASQSTYTQGFHRTGIPTNVTNSTWGPAPGKVNFGMYEGSRSTAGTIYHDGFRRGSSFDAVAPVG